MASGIQRESSKMALRTLGDSEYGIEGSHGAPFCEPECPHGNPMKEECPCAPPPLPVCPECRGEGIKLGMACFYCDGTGKEVRWPPKTHAFVGMSEPDMSGKVIHRGGGCKLCGKPASDPGHVQHGPYVGTYCPPGCIPGVNRYRHSLDCSQTNAESEGQCGCICGAEPSTLTTEQWRDDDSQAEGRPPAGAEDKEKANG